jgi:MFS transporter, PAT family, beta-lactamase induction signal transducer AmpG
MMNAMAGGTAKKRMLFMVLLGFASGLPLALGGGTPLQSWFTDFGMDLKTIGAMSLIGIPYTFKFVWAPLFDRFQTSFMGRRRGWMLIFQVLIAALVFSLSFANPTLHGWWIALACLLVAFSSASQDCVADAYRTELLPKSERGLGMSSWQIGYRTAMLTSGGIALISADYLGWPQTFRWLSALMLIAAIVSANAPEPAGLPAAPRTMQDAFWDPLYELLTRKDVMVLIIFIVSYKLCDALALTISTPFLQRTLGFSKTEVGSISKVFGLASALVGAAIGGAALLKMRLWSALMLFGVLQVVGLVGYLLLAIHGKSHSLLVFAIAAEQVTSGMSGVAMSTLITYMTNQRFTATQFALLSSVSALGRIFVGPVAGVLVDGTKIAGVTMKASWAQFYGTCMLVGTAVLFFLWYLKRPIEEAERSVNIS